MARAASASFSGSISGPGLTTACPMGSQVALTQAPRFRVHAVGAFRQKPGCPEHSISALSPARLHHLCRGECYNPSDERKAIARIEVVRIRPQMGRDEAVADLIEDPWRVLHCDPDASSCSVEFGDSEYPDAGRDTVYYVRAIQEPSLAVNGAQLRCEYDDTGRLHLGLALLRRPSNRLRGRLPGRDRGASLVLTHLRPVCAAERALSWTTREIRFIVTSPGDVRPRPRARGHDRGRRDGSAVRYTASSWKARF